MAEVAAPAVAKGAGDAGLMGAGKGAADALAPVGFGAADLVPGTGFATAADLTAAGATGLAEGTGFATAADLVAPASLADALGAGAAAGFGPAMEFGPAAGAFTPSEAFGPGGTAFAQAGNTLPGTDVSTFGAPSSGVLQPAGATPTGPGAGISPSVDPTSFAAANPEFNPIDAAAGAGGNNPASGGFSLEKLLGSAGKSLMANPVNTALGAAGLGYNIMKGQQMSDAQKAMVANAQRQGDLSAQLQTYLANGTLPPGLQTQLDMSIKSARAKAISNAAAQGLPTDPKRNSALAAQLQSIDQQAAAMTAQIGEQLLTAGGSAAGLSSQLYTNLAQMDMAQTQQMGNAISNFASALSGTKPNVTLKLT